MNNNSEQNIEKPKKEAGESPFSLLSDTQWRYVTAMVENPNFSKKDAAEHLDLSPATVYEWTQKAPYVEEALLQARSDIHSVALERRKQAVLKAIAVKIALLDSEDEGVRSRAATELIEWELGKATMSHEHSGKDGGAIETRNTNVNILAESTHDAGNILSQLAQLGAIPSEPVESADDSETQ